MVGYEEEKKQVRFVEPEPKAIGRTASRNIIREVREENWEEDGIKIAGKKNRKTYKCKSCGKGGIRSDHRNVHACS